MFSKLLSCTLFSPPELLRAKNHTENKYFHSGYMAPEYAIRGFMTAKIDVFSFGVLILEIISGRKNYDPQLNEQNRELLKLVSNEQNLPQVFYFQHELI